MSRSLIEVRADVNVADKFGATPLHYATKNRLMEVPISALASSAPLSSTIAPPPLAEPPCQFSLAPVSQPALFTGVRGKGRGED